MITAMKGSQADKDKIAQLYRELGLTIQTSTAGEEAGVYQLQQLLASNKLKVFASLSGFLAEYRIGDEDSPLLHCCHTLLSSGRSCMRTKPIKRPMCVEPAYLGENSWMICQEASSPPGCSRRAGGI